MNALAKEEVGDYINLHFTSAFQKVGTFRIRGNNKQGGNVASYFCTPDGRVLHAVAGPVKSAEFLREARWVIETWKLAALEADGDLDGLQSLFRKAHLERLQRDHRIAAQRLQLPDLAAVEQTGPIDKTVFELSRGSQRGAKVKRQVHQLLASYPLPRIGRVYALVFEQILNEDISTSPVARS